MTQSSQSQLPLSLVEMTRFHTQQIDTSAYGESGFYHHGSQFQYVLAKADRHVDESRNLYVLGHAGADGIDFVLKPDDDAVYAYYPIEDEVVRLAPDFDSFIKGWIGGTISV